MKWFCVLSNTICTLLVIVETSGKSLYTTDVTPLKFTNLTINNYAFKVKPYDKVKEDYDVMKNEVIPSKLNDQGDIFNSVTENFNNFHVKNKQNVGQPCGNCTPMVSNVTNLTIVINSSVASTTRNKSGKR